MKEPLRRSALLLALTLFSLPGAAISNPLRFFAMGDAPYWEWEFMQLEGLLADVGEARPAFVIHVGDIKSGRSVCTDAYIARIAELFRSVPVPIAYTPGDNEWTDCWRSGGDPEQRLASLRRDLYDDPSVLRLDSLGAVHPDSAYPENYYFSSGGAMFVAVHAVGSDNGLKRKQTEAKAEWQARSAANRTLLEQAAKAAQTGGAQAMVVFFQADPLFAKQGKPNGFAPLLKDLDWLLQTFPGPILVIHGDTHHYMLDHPVNNPETGLSEARLTRLEVPGSPVVAGVWVTYDPDSDEPFSFERFPGDLAPVPVEP